MAQSNYNTLATRKIKENGNVFLALFGAVAIVGIIGATAAGVMKGPMKVMSDISSRAVTENEIIANTKMGVMALSQTGFTKDCDNDGTIEAYPYNSSAIGKTGGFPVGGGYLPSEIDTTRWTDPWGNSYTYCVWDHGTLIDDATCGGSGQNRLPGLNKTTFPAGDVNKQVFIAVLSSGANRTYETTCQDWATADANNDGDLLDVGDTQLVNKPVGSDDIVMSYTYAEAAMATSTNWRIQSTTTDTAEITEDEVEIGGQTASGNGVETTIAGSVMALGGLKLSTDPGDDSISGACNAANDQALRVNTGGASKALEVCESGTWTPISGSSTTAQCNITTPVIANSGNAWVQDNTKLNNPQEVRIKGDYAYVVSQGSSSLTVIDISDPLNPVIANGGNAWIQDTTKLSGAHDLAIQGNYAYVVSRTANALTVVDISDPLNPVIANGGNAWVQDATKLNNVYSVEVKGNYAYATSFSGNSFTVIDISDPLNPVIANGGNAWVQDNTKLAFADGLTISGNYAYVAAYSDYFVVIDISDPLNPVIANGGNAWIQSSIRLDGARDVEVQGNYAYVAVDRDNNFTVVDISDPLNPVIANGGNAWVQDNTKLSTLDSVVLTGNYALVTAKASNALTVIDISDPLNPVIANGGNAWVQDATKLFNAHQAVIKGQYAYVAATASKSLTVIDLGCDPEYVSLPSGSDIGFDPESANCLISNDGPFTLAATQTGMGGYVNDISGDGTYIYAGQGNFLRAYTFDGSTFTEVGARDTGAPVETIFTNNGYVFIANWWQGIEVLKFDGTNFNVVDTYGGLGNTRGVWSDGKTVFAYSAGTINAFSFDGTSLALVSSVTVGGNQKDLWVDGDYIYVADYNGGVGMAVAKWDGNSLSLVDTIDTFQGSIVRPQNGYIFLSDTFLGIRAYTFDGNTITDLGESPQNLNSTKLEVSGTHIFTNNSGASLYAYTYDENGFKVSDSILADVQPLYYDGTYVFTSGSGEMRAYSGFECLKAGDKTPHTSTQIDYTSEQLFDHTASANSTAETYGTSILLKASEFDSEAGVAFNVGSVLGDSEIPFSAITGARVGTSGEGALLFKTKDDSGNLNTNMMIDSDGDLGINTTAPFDVSGKIQIGDLASSGYNSFKPYAANCVVNNGGPMVQVGYYDTPGSTQNIFIDDNYIYIADGTVGGLRAYTFDGTNFTEVGFIVSGNDVYHVWGDGTYIYTSNKANGVVAYTFDGTTFTQVGTLATTTQTMEVWGDGTYLYIADWDGGLHAYTFDGTTFTLLDTYVALTNQVFRGVWGDGTYIYTATSGVPATELIALTFDGSTFSFVGATDTPQFPEDVFGDGTYLYVAVQASGIAVYSFDGSTFTLYDQFDVNQPSHVWSDGVNIITPSGGSKGFDILSFKNGMISQLQNDMAPGASRDIVGDGTYLYGVTSNGELIAYSGYECTKVDGWQGPTHGLLVNNDAEDGKGPFYLVDSLVEGGNKQDILYHNGYIFLPQNLSGIKILKPYKDGILQSVGTFPTTGSVAEIWSDGTYIYTAEGASGMRIYSFDGTNLTELAFYVGVKNMEDVWGDGTYIYSSERDALRAYTFDGTTLTFITNTALGNGGYLWGDGTYIYNSVHSSSSDNVIRAFSFNGTTFTQLNSTLRSNGTAYGQIYSDGTYIYSNSLSSGGLSAYTFNGTTFTEVKQIIGGTGKPLAIWGDGNLIYAVVTNTAANLYDLIAFAFDGTTVTQYGSINSQSFGIAGDGKYIYTSVDGGGGKINIYGGFSTRPISTAFFGNDGTGDVDTNILYSNGLDIKGTNPDGSTLTDILSIDKNGKTTFDQGNVDLIDDAGAFEFLSSINEIQYYNYSTSQGSTLNLNRSRGTKSAPTTVNTGDILGAIMWAGYDGTGIAEAQGNAAIYAKATSAPTNGIIPSGLFFSTDGAGNALGSSDIALLSTGLLGIGTETPTEELSVSGRINLSNGLRIGYDNDCDANYDKGFIRYVTTNNSVEYCTASEWISINETIPQPNGSFNPNAANCVANNKGVLTEKANYNTPHSTRDVKSDGTYIYIADDASGIRAYTFDGTTFTEVGSLDTAGAAYDIILKDSFIYLADGTNGIRAYTFDGTTFTEQGFLIPNGFTSDLHNNGNYVFGSNGTSIKAFVFNGSTITEVGTKSTTGWAFGVWGDNNYAYVADGNNGVVAYTFDGTNFTEVASFNTPGQAVNVWGDGTYIYVADKTSGIRAYTFDGSTFTEVGSYNTIGEAENVWGDGTVIYVADGFAGISAYTFDGTNFTQISSYNTPGQSWATWGDGTYIYVADGGGGGLRAYSGFECTAVKQDDAIIKWDGTENTEIKITASDGATNDYFGASVSIDGNYAIISGTGNDDGGSNSGSAYIFDVTTGTELFKLTASDAAANDNFGGPVAISGNYAVIGAKYAEDGINDSGKAYIFDVTTGAELFQLTASDADISDQFGFKVAISGKYALITSIKDDDAGADAGAVYVFDVTTGTQLRKLTGSDTAAGNAFGYGLAISGKYALIGARSHNTGKGAAYIFDITTGAELFKLAASDAANYDFFGQTVAISENYAIVGANGNDDAGANSGSAYIFDVRTGNELFKLTASDAKANEKFGISVSIDGKYTAIGSKQNSGTGSGTGTGPGKIYIFDVTTGTELLSFSGNDSVIDDHFASTSINGNSVIVGAQFDDDNGSNSGSVYIYQGNWTKRHTPNTGCYPNDLNFNDIINATASTATNTNTITLSGFVKDCTLTLSSESPTIDIIKNAVSVGAPFVDVSAGDTIQLQITSSATAGATYNNIVTLGDKRTEFTIRTTP